MADVRKVIYKTANSAIAGEERAKLAHGEARDVMKIGLQAVRITQKVAGEHDLIAVHNAWDTNALKSLIERMERSSEYKKASGLLQVMKQMKEIVGGAQKKAGKNAERAAQGLPPKRQMEKEMRKRKAEEMASAKDEGDESGRPKKKKSKSSKERELETS